MTLWRDTRGSWRKEVHKKLLKPSSRTQPKWSPTREPRCGHFHFPWELCYSTVLFLSCQMRMSQVVLVVKNPLANAKDIREAGSIPWLGRASGGSMAIHSSVLAWRISWTEEPGELQSMGSQRVGHDWLTFRQEYWSGLPFPSPGDLPDPGIEPASPTMAGEFLTTEPPGKPLTFTSLH